MNELADILAPDYKGNEHILEGLAKSAQATRDEILDTLESVFDQTIEIRWSPLLNAKQWRQ